MNRLREKLLYLIRLLPEIHKEPLNSVIREQTTQLKNEQPWLVWLSGLSANLQTKRSLVRFPVRAHAWVAGQVPSRWQVRGNHTLMYLSLSFSLPYSKSKINKNLFKKWAKDLKRQVTKEDS